jgi:hypothetical protein
MFALQEGEKCWWITELKPSTKFSSREQAVQFCKTHELGSRHYKITELA